MIRNDGFPVVASIAICASLSLGEQRASFASMALVSTAAALAVSVAAASLLARATNESSRVEARP